MKAENHLQIDQKFQFQASAAQNALSNWQLSSLSAYQARLALLKVAIVADYDELLCLPVLSRRHLSINIYPVALNIYLHRRKVR